jgi:hypothetical protein
MIVIKGLGAFLCIIGIVMILLGKQFKKKNKI